MSISRSPPSLTPPARRRWRRWCGRAAPGGPRARWAPAVKEGVIGPDVIIDSKSGVSGAGRTLGLAYHFAEANESVSAYGLAGHRHLPEVVPELTARWPRAEAAPPPPPEGTFT